MESEFKTIMLKGKVVFQKLKHPVFHQRLPKEYYENEACFVFVNEGALSVREPVQLIDLNRQNGLLGKCVNYFYESTENQRAVNDFIEVIGILLYPEIVSELFNFDLSQSDHTVDYSLKQVAINQLLDNYRESINILLDHPELADEQLVISKLKEFVILISKSVDAPSELDFLASMFKPNFAQFEEVIQKNLFTNLSLEELAVLCNMSLSTFKRKFKAVYQQSPSKYIARKKIAKAIELLKKSESRISDIAYDIGFESLASFNRVFKKETGKSPSEYRLS